MKINYDALGQGIYDMFPENDKAVVAFGMIPLYAMETATKLTKEKIAKDALARWEITPTPELMDRVTQSIKQDFVNEFQRELTLAIFRAAKEDDALLV